MLILNNLILNTLNDDSFYINNLIMNTIAQFFWILIAFIINNGLVKFKIWMDQLIRLLKKKFNSYWIPLRIVYND
jgi:hypothetical protein